MNLAERASLDIDSGAQEALVLEGCVLGPDGNAAEGAVVVSSAGGRAVTDAAGSYRLEVEVPSEATSMQLTAVGRSGGNLVASSSVALGGAVRVIRVDPLQLALGGSCSPAWLPTFGGEPGTNDYIAALAVYDDGHGPALYAGGKFTTAGGRPANFIARWDGSSWAALGRGLENPASAAGSGYVLALAVYDDGDGPDLYAGGNFTTAGGLPASYIAKWDGSGWSAVGGGIEEGVAALAVYDDGSGPALYAGGGFEHAGGVYASGVAKWDGASWSAVGSGVVGSVNVLAVHDDGRGPALYAGGFFSFVGDVRAASIARWDGSSWSALGSGVSGWVAALAVYDDGGGPALYAGGNFARAGGIRTNHVAKWDGTSWSALGGGVRGSPYGDTVFALAVHDDGGGPALYAGGSFRTAGGMPASSIAKWDGASWSALHTGVDLFVYALVVHDDGGGPALCTGGHFTTAGGVPVSNIAKWEWNGSKWSVLGNTGMNGSVSALVVHDDGSGPALYAGSPSVLDTGIRSGRIAKWNGSRWSELGNGFSHYGVGALATHDDGGGPALYAAGDFPGGIVKWDGTSWSTLGGGMSNSNGASALAVYDDGGGPALYAGGSFGTAGGVPASSIAKWDGSSWSALGSGVSGGVAALAAYDDGGGPALYAGGGFSHAGGVLANHIAKWNGSSWTSLGSGVDSTGTSYGKNVRALAVFDDGGGPALYAAGEFLTAGGVPVRRIAKWDGSRWSPLGSGMNGSVEALAVYDDGSGPALYAAGAFTAAGDVAANGIARWDGSRWSPLGSGVSVGPDLATVVPRAVRALVVFDGPERGGPALIAGGDFSSAFDSGDSYVARWQGCPDTTPPVLSCPTSITVPDPLSGPPGEIVTFTVTASDDRDASPSVVCEPPSGSFFLPGVTIVQCKATDGARNQSSCSFPVIVQRKQGQ